MSNEGDQILVRMDRGSANVVGNLVENGVGCGNTMNLQTEGGLFDFLRHALFCKAMFASAKPDDSQSAQQCVAMGGLVEKCPSFGMTSSGESRGEHERLQKLRDLQRYVDEHLNYQPLGNFSSFSEDQK